jgi:hypothetical protein
VVTEEVTPPHVLQDPQKGTPLTELPQREMLPLRSPATISKILSQRTPQVPHRTPAERETPVSRVYFYTLPSKSPVNEPPSMFSNRVPMEREALSPGTMVYSFTYICQIPQ